MSQMSGVRCFGYLATRLQKPTRRVRWFTTSRSGREGEVVGPLGPNGAGKTTCFGLIVGLVAADGGSIQLDGENPSRLAIHRRAAWPVVPAAGGIHLPPLTAWNAGDWAAGPRPDTPSASMPCRKTCRSRICRAPVSPRGERRRTESRARLPLRASSCSTSRSRGGPIAVLDIQRIIGFLMSADRYDHRPRARDWAFATAPISSTKGGSIPGYCL
jgi:lipopolysaccharide export system ATP-binding protein